MRFASIVSAHFLERQPIINVEGNLKSKMKNLNKITAINIYITNRVLRNQFEKGMAEDLQSIEAMFEKNDFTGLDEIYKKYFMPASGKSSLGNAP